MPPCVPPGCWWHVLSLQLPSLICSVIALVVSALVFAGTRLSTCVASRPGARVLRLRADGAGGVSQQTLPIRLLPGSERLGETLELGESDGVSELRALRAGRHRWD